MREISSWQTEQCFAQEMIAFLFLSRDYEYVRISQIYELRYVEDQHLIHFSSMFETSL